VTTTVIAPVIAAATVARSRSSGTVSAMKASGAAKSRRHCAGARLKRGWGLFLLALLAHFSASL
jgi:hypothetical protein